MTETVRCAALTFDDGPSSYTSDILDILKQYGIRATFFVLGQELHKYRGTIERMVQEGHVIGNHTWDHPDLTQLSRMEMQHQITSTHAQIKSLTGTASNLLRPPYGICNDEVISVAHGSGLTNVLWNVDSRDWELTNPVPVHVRVLNQLQPQSLILLHDGDAFGCGPRESVLESLPIIIESLRHLNYRFVTVPEFHQLAFRIEHHIE